MRDLDALWDFNDRELSESRFREELQNAASEDDRAEIFTQIARTMSLRKRFDEAHELLDEAAGLMSAGSKAEVRYMLERGRTINSSGGRDASRQVFHQAVDAAKNLGDGHLIVDAMHMVAIVEDGEESLRWTRKAIEYAEASDDVKARNWRASLYNNLGWSLFDSGDLEGALELFEKARPLREERGQVREEQIARWCIARCLREMGRKEEALAMQLKLKEEVGDSDQFVNEELAALSSESVPGS